MIIDLLSHASHYRDLGSRIARGLEWLAAFDVQMQDGRYPIEGDSVYALVQSYDTVAGAEKQFESHRTYLDIQYVAAGTEVILYAPTLTLAPSTPYDSGRDFLLYADPSHSTPLLMQPGNFAIFYPHDGHKPGCINGSQTRIKKVVIKALV